MAAKTAHYDRVVILQSLSEGKTGTRLFDDLNTLTLFTNGIVKAELVDIDEVAGLIKQIDRITQDVRSGRYLPLLHFEAHGAHDSSGLILSSGEFVSWQSLKQPLSELNDATQMNLILCVSACYGAGLVQIVQTIDRAPCWALVGPLEEMHAGDLLSDYTAFYEELFKTKSGGQALKKLNRGRSGNNVLYYFTTAEWFFEKVWVRYVRENCSNDALNKRANTMIQKLRQMQSRKIPTRNEIKKKILASQPSFFEQSVSRFFMLDKYPHVRQRIDVDYAAIMKEAQQEG